MVTCMTFGECENNDFAAERCRFSTKRAANEPTFSERNRIQAQMHPNGASEAPKGRPRDPKWSPIGTPREAKGSQLEPQRHPKGGQGTSKGAPEIPKERPRDPKRDPTARRMTPTRPRGTQRETKGPHASSKSA